MKVVHETLVDSYGRQITYLRISLTDACNFRCIYCAPPEEFVRLRRSHHLTCEEVTRFVRIVGQLGVYRIRLTGGEPLLRDDVVEIVRSLKGVETVKDLSITTNGSRLVPLVTPLKEAGLDRINISLDSLDPKRFREITLSDACEEVLKATSHALRAGFPVKLNVVALKGLTAREIIQFAGLAYKDPLEVRFLEFMPLCGTGWTQGLFVPIAEIRSIVREHFDLEPELPRGDRVAETFRLRGGKGKVGFIGSLSESFCDQCSRIRLSADGRVFPCLFSDVQVSVKELLKEKAPDEKITEAIRCAAQIKPRGNRFRERPLRLDGEDGFGCESLPLIRNIGG